MGTRWLGLLMAGLLGLASPAWAQPETAIGPTPEDAARLAGIPDAEPQALTRADVDAWLDGFFPYALARGDVAGAVVVVVKDGEVLTQRGYGYADVEARQEVDPEATLFRPGSVSKLVTWTAVMQLVERGVLDLDADLNGYLDFEIPPRAGQPVTMRDVLTHTPGFEESIRSLIVFDLPMPPLDQALKRWVPARIYAPGTTPAYSNYATALAGYVVERLSGQLFEDYVEEHVFAPLGMTRSTFRQPLPDELAPLMSKGYRLASGDPEAFELIALAPAGSLSSTGADMARFMLAYLQGGDGLLQPETVAQVFAPGPQFVPAVNRMGLGFYEQWINGRRAVGHGGDTFWFHSYLWLFPDEQVGLYVSMNSGGKDGVTATIRGALFEQFAGRYLPPEETAAPLDPSATAEHAQALAGSYWVSRRPHTSFMRVLQLASQVRISVDAQGRPVVPLARMAGGAPRQWSEVAPYVWRDSRGFTRLAAVVEGDRAVRWTFDDLSPFMVFDRVPWYLDAAWLLPALLASIAVLSLTALSWPVAAIARRRYRQPLALVGRDRSAYRLLRAFAWLLLLVLGGWALLVTMLMSDFSKHESLDWLIWLVQLTGVIAFFGFLAMAVWNAMLVWSRPRGWVAKAWSLPVLLAAVCCLWVALGFKLLSFGTDF